MQVQQTPAAKLSSRYIALEEGFRQFSNDLSKLQVCEVEVFCFIA
jgi:CDK inhibitor PHO81